MESITCSARFPRAIVQVDEKGNDVKVIDALCILKENHEAFHETIIGNTLIAWPEDQ